MAFNPFIHILKVVSMDLISNCSFLYNGVYWVNLMLSICDVIVSQKTYNLGGTQFYSLSLRKNNIFGQIHQWRLLWNITNCIIVHICFAGSQTRSRLTYLQKHFFAIKPLSTMASCYLSPLFCSVICMSSYWFCYNSVESQTWI